jgi:hypothetical protein
MGCWREREDSLRNHRINNNWTSFSVEVQRTQKDSFAEDLELDLLNSRFPARTAGTKYRNEQLDPAFDPAFMCRGLAALFGKRCGV